MTGRAARIASAVLLASILPFTANAAKPVVEAAVVLDTTGSTGPLIEQIVDDTPLGERLATRRDDHVAARKNTSDVKTEDSFDRAVGGALQAQTKR